MTDVFDGSISYNGSMTSTPNLAAELSDLPPSRDRFPWPDHEYVRGWGVFGLPFDSGHYLALRVFPQNDFAPYITVWHRDPQGRWSIFAEFLGFVVWQLWSIVVVQLPGAGFDFSTAEIFWQQLGLGRAADGDRRREFHRRHR